MASNPDTSCQSDHQSSYILSHLATLSTAAKGGEIAATVARVKTAIA
jgi:hypothetical protein